MPFLNSNFIEISYQGSDLQWVFSGSGKGLPISRSEPLPEIVMDGIPVRFALDISGS